MIISEDEYLTVMQGRNTEYALLGKKLIETENNLKTTRELKEIQVKENEGLKKQLTEARHSIEILARDAENLIKEIESKKKKKK